MKNEYLLGLGALAILVIGIVFIKSNYLDPKINEPQIETLTTEDEQVDQTETLEQTLTKEEVATHNTPDNCYVIIEGRVYDLSNFNDKHPGGSKAIELSCGADGTQLFTTRGDKGPHSEQAQTTLDTFFLAELE